MDELVKQITQNEYCNNFRLFLCIRLTKHLNIVSTTHFLMPEKQRFPLLRFTAASLAAPPPHMQQILMFSLMPLHILYQILFEYVLTIENKLLMMLFYLFACSGKRINFSFQAFSFFFVFPITQKYTYYIYLYNRKGGIVCIYYKCICVLVMVFW